MSVGFGFSVGDFIAALKLVGTVIDALRESSHASSSFRSLIDELYALESALIRVKRLDLDERHHVGKLALQQAASQCQRTIDAFWKEIQKYQPHLQQNGTDSRLKDGWAKVRWAVCRKKDLETFRAQIRGNTSSIEMLLLVVQMEATTVDTRKQDSHHKSLASKIQDLSCQVMGKLTAIADSVGQSVQQGKALLESSAQIVQINLRVFQIVHDIQLFILRIPGQVQRQQPVYLIDPLNRESPFHLEFVRSTEALLAVLKVNLKESGCGPAMIDRGEFAIEELGTQSSIDLTRSWDSCFYPGQRVAMSMIFKPQQRIVKSSCPRCGKGHQESTGKEITCIACGTVFRRIEEVVEDTRDTSTQNSSSSEFGDMPEMPVHGPTRPHRKRRQEDDALKNLRKFRRIQLVDASIVLGSVHKRKGNRLKVYELVNNDWFDRGTGFGACIHVNGDNRIHVQSEDEPDHILLEHSVTWEDGYQKQQGTNTRRRNTMIVWTDETGTDMALSFQEPEGCEAIWKLINDAVHVSQQRHDISEVKTPAPVVGNMNKGKAKLETSRDPKDLEQLVQQVMRELPVKVQGVKHDAEKAAALAKLNREFDSYGWI